MSGPTLNEHISKRLRFTPSPEKPLSPNQDYANDLLFQLEQAERHQLKIVQRLKLEAAWEVSVRAAWFEDMDPKEIPVKDLLTLARSDAPTASVEARYKERIRSPLTGIRSFCVTCQGGSTLAVSQCPSANCPLWPFRLGNNPFYGKIANAEDGAGTEEPEIDEPLSQMPAAVEE